MVIGNFDVLKPVLVAFDCLFPIKILTGLFISSPEPKAHKVSL